jgi:hypothetical protein
VITAASDAAAPVVYDPYNVRGFARLPTTVVPR